MTHSRADSKADKARVASALNDKDEGAGVAVAPDSAMGSGEVTARQIAQRQTMNQRYTLTPPRAGLANDEALLGVDDGDGSGEGSSSSAHLAALKAACFATLRELAHNSSIAKPLLLLFWVFDFLQILTFPLSPSATMPWGSSPLMRNVHLFLLPIAQIPGTDYPGVADSSPLSLFVAAVVLALVPLALFAWAVYANAGFSNYRPRWRINLLRFLIWFSLHAFYIPITSSLLAPLACGGPQAEW